MTRLPSCFRTSVRGIFILSVLLNLVFASISLAEIKVITVPKNPLKPSVPHSAYNGRRTVFKAICRETTATTPPGVSGTIVYQWDYNGDGVFDSGNLTTTNPYNLEAVYTYPNVTEDTPVIAVVRAKRSTASDWESYASYPVWIYSSVPATPNSGTTILADDDEMTVMRDVAIDDALWWLHKKLTSRSGSSGTIIGHVPRTTYGSRSVQHTGREVAANAAIMWAFQIQGHLAAYPPGTSDVPALNTTYWENDPYAETVCRMLNYVLSGLSTEAVTSLDEGDDGTTPIAGTNNGIGLCAFGGQHGRTYDTGVVLGGLSLSGLQGTAAKVGNATYVKNRKIEAIIQELVDWVVMAQHESGNPKGGWYYVPTTSTGADMMDASTAQWAYIALEAAETAMGNYGVHINQRCKHRIPFVLQNNQHTTGAAQYRNNTGSPDFQLTGGAIVACAWLGWDTFSTSDTTQPYTDQGSTLTKGQCRQIYDKYLAFISNNSNWLADMNTRIGQYNQGDWWSSNNQGATYAMYSIQKGLRTLSAAPVYVGSHNWFQEYSTYYINNQERTLSGTMPDTWYGSWHDDTADAWITYYHSGTELSTAFGVLILTPSVFESKPIAYAEARPMEPVEGCSGGNAGQVTFYHDKSFTVDPKRTINYYKYFFDVPAATTNYDTLDWNNPDYVIYRDPNAEPVWTYQYAGTYKAVLRVEDDNPNGAQHSYYTITGINVQESQNIAPTAIITGVAPTVINSKVVIMKRDQVANMSGATSTDPNFSCLDTVTYAWNTGSGYVNGSATKSVDVDQVYSLPAGPYPIDRTVKLKVTDSAGLFHEDTVTLRIYGLTPTAVLEAGPNPVACNTTVTFDGSQSTSSIPGTYGIVEYEWDFGDGTTTTTTTNQTTHAYSQYGTYTARLRVRDSDGSTNWSAWDQVAVNVSLSKQNPIADAGGPYVIGSGDALDMLDATGSSDPDTACGGGIISYEWDIDGDGDYDENISTATPDVSWATLSSLINPMQYSDPVTSSPVYTVTLRVTDEFGATAENNALLYIYHNKPFAVLGSVNPAACNETVTIDGGASYHGYPQAGHHIASYTITFGDGDSTSGSGMQFGETIPAVTHSYGQYGSYTVTLTVWDDNGIQDSITTTVDVNQGNLAPVAHAGGAYAVNENGSLQLDATASTDSNIVCGDVLSYAWDLDDDGLYDDASGAQPSLTWAQLPATLQYPADPVTGLPSNVVRVQVTDSFGVSSVAQTQLRIYGADPIILLSASPNPAACGQEVSFSAAGSTHEDPRRSIILYEWDLDDNGSYETQGVNVTHTFTAFGTYTVRARITDDLDNIEEDIIVVNVTQGNIAPVADANGPYVINEGDGITLHGTSTDSNSTCETSVTYEWDINGDGDYTDPVDVSGSDPELTWADIESAGWQHPAAPDTGEPKNLIRLRVTDTLGLTGERTTYVRIYHDGPYAVIQANPGSAACNETVAFDARTSYHGRPDKTITAYNWDLDNDGVYDDASGNLITHSFPQYGNHQVGLQVADADGTTDTDSVIIAVNQGNLAPVASAGGPYSMEVDGSVTLDASASADPNSACGDYIVLYEWDIDSNGTYDFNSSSATMNLTWNQIDVPGITLTYPADPATGQPYTQLTARVTDSMGMSATKTGILRIYGDQPVAGFSVIPQVVPIKSNGEANFTLDASASRHTSPGNSIVQYQWDLNDDGSVEYTGSSAVQSGVYTFPNSTETRVMAIRLTVTDDNNPAKTDSTVVNVTFQPPPTPPTAGLIVRGSVGGDATSVIELGYGAVLDAATSTDPDFGDPFYDYFKQVEWDIDGNGTYDVVRVAQDTNGDTIVDYNDDPVDLVLELTSAELTSYGITPNIAYTAVVRVTDSWDKQDTAAAQFTVMAADVMPVLAANPNPAGCQQVVTLDASMSYNTFPGRTIVGYEWDLDDDEIFELDTGSVATTTVSYPAYGTYTVRVRVTDDQGVSSSTPEDIVVDQGNSPPVANTGGPYVLNYGEGFTLNGSGTDLDDACQGGIASYAWDLDGDGQFDDASGATPAVGWTAFESLVGGAVSEGAEYPVSLQVTDQLGLSGTHTGYLEFYNNEVIAHITAIPNPASCGAEITLDATGSYNTHPDYDVVLYEWDFSYDETAGFQVEQQTAESQITHSFNMFTTYRVAVRAIDNNTPARSAVDYDDVVISEGNLAPIAATGGPYMQEIGLDVMLNASASYEPDAACGDMIEEYAWDINNNGSFDDQADIKSGSAISTLPWSTMSTWPVAVAQTVKLRITDMFGVSTIKSTTVTVYENEPVAQLSANVTNAACNQTVTFDGSASYHTYPARGLVTFRWDFDYDGVTPEWDCEGTPAQVGVMTHSYDQYGTYTVLLQVVDNNDPAKTSDATKTIYVDQGNQNPVAVIAGALQISVNDNLQLNGTQSSDPNTACGDYIVSYDWDIDGDGLYTENITGEVIDLPWASYQSMVEYPAGPVSGTPSNTVTLRVTDHLGGTGTKSVQLRIYNNDPVALFTATPNPAQCNQTISFDASGAYHENPTHSLVTYRWDFDFDGSTPTWDASGGPSTHKQITHSYNLYGDYTVLLEVTDNNVPAKTDTFTLLVSIDPALDNVAPVASDGGPYVLSQGDALTLNASGTTDANSACGDTIVSYEWDIDGDNVYDGANDITGATPTIPWSTLAALNLPVADPVTQSPANSIGVRVTDAQGASATARTVLRIYVNEPVAVARASSQQISCGQTVTLSGDMSYHQHPGHSIVTYQWDFEDDGTFDETGIEVTHDYLVYGSHTARLRVTDDQGKTSESTVTVTLSFVNVNPVANPGGPYTTSILNGSAIPITLDASRSSDPNAPCDSVVEYAWDTDGDGLFGTADTNGVDLNGDQISDVPTDYVGASVNYVNHAWQRGVSYIIKLKVKDSLGAWSAETSTQIDIQNSPPPVLALISPDGGECLRGTTQIEFTLKDPEGEVVTITAKVGGTTIGTKNIDTPDDGSWVTDSIAFNTTTIVDGTNYKVLLEASDTGGGTSSDDSAAKFTIDNTPPAAPTVSVPASGVCYAGSAPATSASSTDNITVNPTITRVDTNDGCSYTSTFTATDGCGNQSSATVVTYQVSDASLAIAINGVVEGGVYAPGTGVTYSHTAASNCVTSMDAIWSMQGGAQNQPYTAGDPFTDPGTYTVTVTVENICGGQHTASKSFVINGAPVADAGGPYTGTEGVDVSLSAGASHDPDGLPLAYAWDLDGDGEYDDAETMDTVVQFDTVGTYTVGLRVTDSLGASATDSAQVTVDNTAPVVEAGVTQTVNEGDTVTFDGSFTDIGDEASAHTIEWSFGDGATTEGTLTPAHVYSDNDSYTVTLTVTDDDDASASDTVLITVLNLPPTVDAGPDQVENEGVAVTFNATYTDPGSLDTHTVSINWGDGTIEDRAIEGGTFDGTHTYFEQAVYTVTVTVEDDDGAQSTDTFEVNIGNSAPVVDPGTDLTVVEGDTVTFDGSFSDTGDETSAHTVEWSFGDGATAEGTLTPTHVYGDNDTYTVTLTVTDDDGDSASNTMIVTVQNAPPVVDAGPDHVDNEGNPITFTATYSDPGTLDTHTATVDWGNGTVEEFSVDSGTFSSTYAYVYKGDYTVTVTVTDDDGDAASDTFLVTVENSPPVAEAGPDQTVNEGDSVAFAGSYTDIGGDIITHSFAWLFGDGQSAQGSLTPTNVYGDNDEYTVTFIVTDDEGDQGTDTLVVMVQNIPPVVDAGPDIISNEGEPLTFTATYSDPGTLDTHRATVDWGDGNSEEYPISGGTFDGTHTYLYKGTYTVNVTVTDDDGAQDSDTFQATIGRVPLNLDVVAENDLSATILFNGIPGKSYDVYYYDGSLENCNDMTDWNLFDTVFVVDQGLCNDAGDPGDDGQFGTADDVRLAPCDISVRYYRVVEAGSIDAGDPWASGQIGYYTSCILVDGRNFIGKTGCAATLNEAVDCRFLRLGHDVQMMHQGIKIDYYKNDKLEKAFVYDADNYLLWSDGNGDVSADPVATGKGFMMTLNPGMGPIQLPMTGIIETTPAAAIDLQPGYTLVSWPYTTEATLTDCGLVESGFKGDIRARTADMIYFWNPQTQAYDLPVFYYTGTGEWRYYDQTPCTRTLKPGESFLIRRQSSSQCSQWIAPCPHDVPTRNLQ